ncbi:hypothetical protein EB73_15910 [Mycobacterium sp. SWH-M3]|nr:hypothetical protein EB73_15910 [Mycobacterium sp. SWH-M3]
MLAGLTTRNSASGSGASLNASIVMVRRNSVTSAPGRVNWYSTVMRPGMPPLPSASCPRLPTELNTHMRGRVAMANCHV